MDEIKSPRLQPWAKLKCAGGRFLLRKTIITPTQNLVQKGCSCLLYSRIRRCSCCRDWFPIRCENLRIKAMMQGLNGGEQ